MGRGPRTAPALLRRGAPITRRGGTIFLKSRRILTPCIFSWDVLDRHIQIVQRGRVVVRHGSCPEILTALAVRCTLARSAALLPIVSDEYGPQNKPDLALLVGDMVPHGGSHIIDITNWQRINILCDIVTAVKYDIAFRAGTVARTCNDYAFQGAQRNNKQYKYWHFSLMRTTTRK